MLLKVNIDSVLFAYPYNIETSDELTPSEMVDKIKEICLPWLENNIGADEDIVLYGQLIIADAKPCKAKIVLNTVNDIYVNFRLIDMFVRAFINKIVTTYKGTTEVHGC